MRAEKLRPIPLICDGLPDRITVCGREYRVETDFRRWIIVTQIFEAELSPYLTLELCAECVCPEIAGELENEDIAREFLSELVSFLLRGKSAGGGGRAVMDFAADRELIYAAFYSAYGIDLAEARLHWHKFLALLTALPSDCELMKVIALRELDVTEIKDDRMRKRFRKAKEKVRI